MSGSRKSSSLAKAILVMVIGGFLVKAALDSRASILPVLPRSNKTLRGEYGGDLDFLRRFHVGPQDSNESNHYIDMWSPGTLPALAKANGLTNNRALFVDSHGGAGFQWHGRGYGLFPRETLLEADEPTPSFSAADVAAILGPLDAAQIHNIVIAGCNEEGRFSSKEWRKHFVNATNITHMTAGKLAIKPMFYQAIVTPSSEIQPMFGKVLHDGECINYELQQAPSREAEPMGAYVADLFLPGAHKPYRTQPAGRELLEPSVAPSISLRADLAPTFARP